MLRIVLLLLLSGTVSFVLAQVTGSSHSETEPHVCGQVNTPEQIAFLKANNPNLRVSLSTSMDTIRVPVLFHRIADENGNGAVTEANCADALVALNALYAPGRIVFEECESPRLIADSVFFEYEYSEEFALRQAHEVAGVINVFIPNTATSSSGGRVCGYAYLPPTRRDLTMVAASCFTNGTTFPHEVGHFLGLYHTHGTSNCGALTDELVDGSNCATGGDDVCDTPADPNLLGIDCDAYVVDRSCNYTGTEVDANGDTFAPDTRNIMSYSRKACREGFSAGQLERVRFYLGTSRSYLTCPVDVCTTTDPDPLISDWSMTELTIELDDNGQQSTEVEYTVAGGTTTRITTTQTRITLSGFSPCDDVEVRARNVCSGGVGEWSAFDDVKLDGCNLEYCPQPNNNLEIDFSDLMVDNTQLQDLITLDNYGIHTEVVTVVVDPSNPIFELSFIPSFFSRNGPDSMYVQVWIDEDFDKELEANERLLQVKASTASTFQTSIPIAPSLPRSQQMRMRVTASVESFIDACETEFGETEDVDIVFVEDTRTVEWGSETTSVDATAQAITLPLIVEMDWVVTGLPSWIAAPATSGVANTAGFEVAISRNTGCDARTATLLITGVNGLTDELVITQMPPAAGITVSVSDTVVVGPLEGEYEFSTASLHRYDGSSSDSWLPFRANVLLDEVTHQLAYPINSDLSDRISHVNFEGCGVLAGFVLKQEVGRTAWVNSSDIQLTAIGDTVKLDVASNVDWDGSTTTPWLSALGIAGSGNGQVMYIYTGEAASGEMAEIVLNGNYGLTEGDNVVRVFAPILSGTSTPSLSAKLVTANPFSDHLKASTKQAQPYFWSVQSSLGQELHASFGESLHLDTAHWPAGTYFLRLEDEAGRMLVQRVVKF